MKPGVCPSKPRRCRPTMAHMPATNRCVCVHILDIHIYICKYTNVYEYTYKYIYRRCRPTMAMTPPALGHRLPLIRRLCRLRTWSMRAAFLSPVERLRGVRMGASWMMGSMIGSREPVRMLMGMLMGAPRQRLRGLRMGAWHGPAGEIRGRGVCGFGRIERRESLPATARACWASP